MERSGMAWKESHRRYKDDVGRVIADDRNTLGKPMSAGHSNVRRRESRTCAIGFNRLQSAVSGGHGYFGG